MTVRELLEKLQSVPPDAQVYSEAGCVGHDDVEYWPEQNKAVLT